MLYGDWRMLPVPRPHLLFETRITSPTGFSTSSHFHAPPALAVIILWPEQPGVKFNLQNPILSGFLSKELDRDSPSLPLTFSHHVFK